MLTSPKVSIIMPSLNVGQYIRECIESVVNQTLKEIEIICVDAGSTDGTLEILEEYAASDNRIRLVHSDMKSYGHQMNLGIKAATGEYIGIVETDDYVRETMYERLFALATKYDLDFIKADFYRFKKINENLELTYNQLSQDTSKYNKILNPAEDISLFNLILNTWSGIYKKAFIVENGIYHNETPGAAFQDNGFWFKTFALAKKCYFVNEPFYMNRRDNLNSSVYSRDKVYCMNEEYKYILNFLDTNPEIKRRLMPTYCYKKYQNYMFTYNRIGEKHKLGYIVRFSEEFSEDLAKGFLDAELFGQKSWNNVTAIINDPLKYYLNNSSYLQEKYQDSSAQLAKYKTQVEYLSRELVNIRSSWTYRIGRFITFIPRKIRGGIRCYKEHGWTYTFNRLLIHLRIKRTETVK